MTQDTNEPTLSQPHAALINAAHSQRIGALWSPDRLPHDQWRDHVSNAIAHIAQEVEGTNGSGPELAHMLAIIQDGWHQMHADFLYMSRLWAQRVKSEDVEGAFRGTPMEPYMNLLTHPPREQPAMTAYMDLATRPKAVA